MTLGESTLVPARLRRLTSLRFFAAAMVLLHHTFALLMPDSVFAKASRAGFVGVGFFFVLSGFILMWTYRADLPKRYFYGRRVARIYPVHLLTALLAAGLIVILGGGIEWPQAILNLLLLQSWVPVESYGSSLNGVSWSLCCEAFFYLCFPFIAHRFQGWGVRKVVTTISVALVVVALLVIFTLPVDVAQQFLYKGPAYRIGGFMLGVVLAVWMRSGGHVRTGMQGAVTIAAGSYALALAATPVAFRLGLPDLRVYADLITLPAVCLVIVAAASADISGKRSWLTAPWMVRFGDASFSLYMVHYLLLAVCVALIGPADSTTLGIAYVAGVSIIAVGLSVATYRWFEHPMEARVRRRIGTPRPAPVTV